MRTLLWTSLVGTAAALALSASVHAQQKNEEE